MVEIPEDVKKAARQAIIHSDYPNLTRRELSLMFPIVAGAIMAERERFMNEFEDAADGGIDAAIEAERERCARIAESFLSHGDKLSQRKAIADRIRSSQP